MHQLLAFALAILSVAVVADAQPSQSPLVTVTASDHSFQAPDTLRAGLTRFRMNDLGPTDHQLVIYRLSDSVSLNEFYLAMS